ncbi:tetratricopeptide repeat protein [Streptomyces sp. WMMC500]|uniref:tetratricopeptide repeat protein n=1 Tax=Streptomyces sp. WMMC500 TaxID=3015154 RepID=UPI00248D0518|nr:tetratricopeptide repeat protein [Streptomyces sp. WMMC500]WBB64346.1 tetratricopeptide repeat protein [Streptomyces sp. WMMC500]
MFRRRRRQKRAEAGNAPAGNAPAGDATGGGVRFSTLPSETAARQEAATGDPVAMNRLGIILKTNGRADEAADWFRRAGEAGNNDAMANLAMYLMSQGRNEEAAQWFERAGGPLGEGLASRLRAESDGDGGPPGAPGHRAG